jgi:hypothetical protein
MGDTVPPRILLSLHLFLQLRPLTLCTQCIALALLSCAQIATPLWQ